MTRFLPVSTLLLATLLSAGYAKAADDSQDAQDTKKDDKLHESVTVKGERIRDTSYTVTNSDSATKMNISTQETPQSVNVTTRQEMNDFKLDTAREVLGNTPGVTVQTQETERTSYTSRGSEISSFQTDGLGFPFDNYNYQTDDIDTYIYDRIEVVKGANGLTSSLGEPGATVNFIRKRPTHGFQSDLGVSYGSWNTRRVEGDVSGKILGSGSVRGRISGAAQQGDSYLDHYSRNKGIVSGVIEADLTDTTLLTLGTYVQRQEPKGNNWGALPLLDQAGNQLSYSRNYNPNPDWSVWNSTIQNSFVELQQKLGSSWVFTATLQGVADHENTSLNYYSGAPDATGGGVSLYSARYRTDEYQTMVDGNFKGSYDLFGENHEAVIGASTNRDYNRQRAWGATNAPTIANWYTWTGEFARPDYEYDTTPYGGANHRSLLTTIYGATRIHLTHDLKWLVGLNQVKADNSGDSYGVKEDLHKSKTLPYTGLTYNINENYTPYFSYSTIYRPQLGLQTNGEALKPTQGMSYETGVKGSWLNEALTATLALFETYQNDYPLRASDSAAIIKKYDVGNLRTQGFEIDASGKITELAAINFGYTQVKMKDTKSGEDTRTYVPSRTFNILGTYKIPTLTALKVGAGLRWQDKVHQDVTGTVFTPGGQIPYQGTIRQGAYALVDLMASYDFNSHMTVQVNGENIGDKKYLNGFPDGEGYYGAPANYLVSVNWKN